jgi:hypothetical protein
MSVKLPAGFVSPESVRLLEQEGLESEHHLARRLEISLKDCAHLRRGFLREGYHWELRNSTVYYTPNGIEEVVRLLPPELKQAPAPPRPWFGPPRDTPLSKTIVEVVRIPPNPRFLTCRDMDGRPVAVRVRSNTKFLRGMKIDVVHQCKRDWTIDYGDGRAVYQFIAQPPRLIGRW